MITSENPLESHSLRFLTGSAEGGFLFGLVFLCLYCLLYCRKRKELPHSAAARTVASHTCQSKPHILHLRCSLCLRVHALRRRVAGFHPAPRQGDDPPAPRILSTKRAAAFRGSPDCCVTHTCQSKPHILHLWCSLCLRVHALRRRVAGLCPAPRQGDDPPAPRTVSTHPIPLFTPQSGFRCWQPEWPGFRRSCC